MTRRLIIAAALLGLCLMAAPALVQGQTWYPCNSGCPNTGACEGEFFDKDGCFIQCYNRLLGSETGEIYEAGNADCGPEMY